MKDESATAQQLTDKTKEVGDAAQEIGKIIYEAAQKEQAAGGEGQKGPDVVDAEVVDDKKDENK